jgi:predicted MFS family arabinose efflux permease
VSRPAVTLGLLTAVFAVSHLDRQIVSISLNAIGVEFALNDTQLGMLSGLLFAVFFVVFSLPAAHYAAYRNRRPLISVAIAVWSALTVAAAGAQSFFHLAATRIGVAIGEAGAVAPAHAMICDLYPPNKRVSALATFVSGSNIGLLLAFAVGGMVGQIWGWRWAFVVAGLPGLFLALALWRFADEPARPKPDDPMSGGTLLRETLSRIWTDRSILHALMGLSLTGIVTHGALAWNPAFMIRLHGLNVAQAGLLMALIIGIGGATGTIISGRLADKLGAKDSRWRMRIVMLSVLIAKPFALVFLLSESTTVALSAITVSASLGSVFWAPTFAHAYERLPKPMRPMATAVFLFAFNIIGLGIGPTIVGFLSDIMASSSGPRSLGYALAIVQIAGLWALWHYWQVMQADARDQGGKQNEALEVQS